MIPHHAGPPPQSDSGSCSPCAAPKPWSPFPTPTPCHASLHRNLHFTPCLSTGAPILLPDRHPPSHFHPRQKWDTLPPGGSLEAEKLPQPAEDVSQIKTLSSQGPVASSGMRVWAAPLLPGRSHRGLGGQGAGRGLQLPAPPATPLQLPGVLTSLRCAWPRGHGGHTAAGTHCCLGGQGCSDRAWRGNLPTQLSLPGLSGHSKGRPGPHPQLGPLSQARHLPREGHKGRLATLRTRAAGQRPGPGASSWTKGPCVAEWVFILEAEST